MYELTINTDLTFLKNAEFNFLGLGKKNISIGLWKEIKFIVNTAFLFNGELLSVTDGYKLYELSKKKITNVVLGENYGHLILEFEDNNKLELFAERGSYFSYLITSKDCIIVV